MRTYIAGKMRGIPFFNYPVFDAARDHLISLGHEVVSPADIDRSNGFDPFVLWPAGDWDWNNVPQSFSMADAVRRDVEAIIGVDSLCLLPGWQSSKGAVAEKAIAEWLGKEVFELEVTA